MKIPVHNPGAMPIYVHGAMILPGETRHFDEQDVPTHLRPKAEGPADAAPAESVQDLIADLQKLGVKDIVLALPDLTDDDLARLEALEHAAEKPRKSLEHAIAEEKLQRAAAEEAKKAEGGAGNEGGNADDKGGEA